MIELPEALTYKRELEEFTVGKVVDKVLGPSSPHKFCWFNGEPACYHEHMAGRRVCGAGAFGIYAELELEDGVRLAFNDGVSVRLLGPKDRRPARYQLMVDFTDGYSLVFSVSMYGGIICHSGNYDNEYYVKSRESVSPLSSLFDREYFQGLISGVKPSASAKAFLATEQRIPGLGNGCLQDILFRAGMNPRKKLEDWSDRDGDKVFHAIKDVMADMTEQGGRDTEKNLLGNAGGYRTLTHLFSSPIQVRSSEKASITSEYFKQKKEKHYEASRHCRKTFRGQGHRPGFTLQ